jgi:hypothetical protein
LAFSLRELGATTRDRRALRVILSQRRVRWLAVLRHDA